MPIEQFGLGVPDVDAARVYYDELMPMVGFQPCFGRGGEVRGTPKALPEFGPHYYATYFLDPHGFMIEVASHEPGTDDDQE